MIMFAFFISGFVVGASLTVMAVNYLIGFDEIIEEIEKDKS